MPERDWLLHPILSSYRLLPRVRSLWPSLTSGILLAAFGCCRQSFLDDLPLDSDYLRHVWPVKPHPLFHVTEDSQNAARVTPKIAKGPRTTVALTILGYACYAVRFMPSVVVVSIMNVSGGLPMAAGMILLLQERMPCKRNSWVTIWIS